MLSLIITLIIAGLVFLVFELLVVPGFGVMGILGISSFIISGYLAFANMGVSVGVMVVAAEVLLIILAIIFVLRSKTWRKITLDTNINAKIDELPHDKGIAVGTKGKAVTRLAPAGQAEFGDTTIEVFSRDTVISAGCSVEVVEVEENRVFVEKLT